MKKLLSIISAVSLTAISTISVVSCTSIKENTSNNQYNFLTSETQDLNTKKTLLLNQIDNDIQNINSNTQALNNAKVNLDKQNQLINDLDKQLSDAQSQDITDQTAIKKLQSDLTEATKKRDTTKRLMDQYTELAKNEQGKLTTDQNELNGINSDITKLEKQISDLSSDLEKPWISSVATYDQEYTLSVNNLRNVSIKDKSEIKLTIIIGKKETDISSSIDSINLSTPKDDKDNWFGINANKSASILQIKLKNPLDLKNVNNDSIKYQISYNNYSSYNSTYNISPRTDLTGSKTPYITWNYNNLDDSYKTQAGWTSFDFSGIKNGYNNDNQYHGKVYWDFDYYVSYNSWSLLNPFGGWTDTYETYKSVTDIECFSYTATKNNNAGLSFVYMPNLLNLDWSDSSANSSATPNDSRIGKSNGGVNNVPAPKITFYFGDFKWSINLKYSDLNNAWIGKP